LWWAPPRASFDPPAEEAPDLAPDLAARAEEYVREMLEGRDTSGDPPVSPAQARAVVQRLWLLGVPPASSEAEKWGRPAEQEEWDGPTDPDRVTDAFGAGARRHRRPGGLQPAAVAAA
jgi:hypothetical protein